ncbi:MAG: transposase IS4 family protein [Ferroplasma sp. Type II]|uniref:IS1634 family transposase n=1 Tax=Ferroplasma sp. Type II TaxID=261388 RepID=UPI0003896FC5|nr:IS1634 family transposase [Ferroplasma sp. Type II]EQB73494.1 MAG: transposase IS4 family protein [Ferroplasma sp. Type II]
MRLRVNSVKRGKSLLKYAQIVEDYVEDGKKKTRIVKHLGPVHTEKDIEEYRKLFALENRKLHVEKADLRTLDIMPPREYGMVYAAEILCRDLGIDHIFRMLGNYSRIIFLSVVSRLVNPSSDIGLLRILEKTEYPVENISKDRIYSALDKLISMKDEIETSIVNMLKPDMKRVYYDLTSTYFEGKEKNDLVLFGYSRDKKRGKKQINIGLMMADGIPIHHEVFPGNTVDPKTLEPMNNDLRKKFHVKRIIFFGDRAFGRRPSLRYLDKNEYVTAVYRWDQPYKNILKECSFNDEHYLEDIEIYAREVEVKWNTKDMGKREIKRTGNRRAIAIYNKDRENEDIADVEEKVSIVKEIMKSGKKGKDLVKALGSLKPYTKSNGTELNAKRIDEKKRLAGRFMIVTDTDLPIGDIVKGYKDLWRIERSFRTIKSFLEIRPVNHSKEERIEAHVFICVLSLLIARLFEKSMNNEMTVSVISDMLSELKAIPVRTADGIITLRSESENARHILEKMKIPYPGKILSSVPT